MLMRLLTFKRSIFFGFPIYLVIAEYAIRFLISYAPGRSEDLAIVGSTSTVTAAGLSLIAPVLIPKPVLLNQAAAQMVTGSRVVIVGVGDQRLISLAYVALLVLPFAWGWALWMIHASGTTYDIPIGTMHLPAPFAVAVAIYLIGMVFNEIKEVV